MSFLGELKHRRVGHVLAFEITPDGIKRTGPAELPSHSQTTPASASWVSPRTIMLAAALSTILEGSVQRDAQQVRLSRGDRHHQPTAARAFEEATRLDPEFAEQELSQTQFYLGRFDGVRATSGVVTGATGARA